MELVLLIVFFPLPFFITSNHLLAIQLTSLVHVDLKPYKYTCIRHSHTLENKTTSLAFFSRRKNPPEIAQFIQNGRWKMECILVLQIICRLFEYLWLNGLNWICIIWYFSINFDNERYDDGDGGGCDSNGNIIYRFASYITPPTRPYTHELLQLKKGEPCIEWWWVRHL